MVPKLSRMRVPAASLATRNVGLSVVWPVMWVRLLVPRLPGWRGWEELERGMEGKKLRKGEGIEQKRRDGMCVHGGDHQKETL